MRVCLLTPEFLPSWGGIGTYAYTLAKGLRDRAEIHVVTSRASLHEQAEQGIDGVQVHALPSHSNQTAGVSSIRFQIAVGKHLPRLAREHGFDIVHANHAQMSDLLARLRRMPARRVVTVHTTVGTQLEGTLGAGSGPVASGAEQAVLRHRRLLRILERGYLRRSKSLIFVSRWVRDRALRQCGIHPKRSQVVRNAVDLQMFQPRDGCGGPATAERTDRANGGDSVFTLLYAGRLLAQKGLGTLVAAMREVPPNVRLIVAGPGDPAPWREYARGLGISRERIAFVGRVPYARMPDLYHRADAVVLPSFAESCPMVALEAMASGTPLIGSNIPGIAEIARDDETGWLFPAGDARALASRVEAVVQDGGPVERVTRQARSWVESHATIQRMASETFQFYRSALGEVDT
jgi:glycosyltransferase involved in cell wall biosynthesis